MSFFRTYIDKEIQEELFNRIDSLNFQKSPEGILNSVQSSVQHQFVKSCWARASVVLGKGEVESLNSNLDENKNPINEPLNIKNGKLTRGKPGITSISTSFKEYFMKQGTINFFVPDPKEFDEFKDNFLKFGRYMLVEFGWSLPYNLQLPSLSGDTVLEISKNLQQRVLAGNGNYNAFVGQVTNYTFSQTKEGAYEGTIEISSMGRNIFGQKSSVDGKVENIVGYVNQTIQDADKSKKDDIELSSTQKDIFRNLRKTFVNFNSTITNLDNVIEYYVKQDNKPKGLGGTPFTKEDAENLANSGRAGAVVREGTNYYSKRGVVYTEKFLTMKKNGSDENQDRHIFVSWGWFEDYILNSFFSFASKEDDGKVFKTEFFSARNTPRTLEDEKEVPFSPTLCKSHPRLVSLGFESIILPGKTKNFGEKNAIINVLGEGKTGTPDKKQVRKLIDLISVFNDSSICSPFEPKSQQDKRGIIRNMMFNVEYLKESFVGTQNIEVSINNFWQKVSNDYGGFWRFSLIEDPKEVDGRVMVTDMNIGEVNDTKVSEQLSKKDDDKTKSIYKVFPFKVYSRDSIISDFQITSENSSEMATLAVYGSNVDLSATSADIGKGYTSLAMRALSMIDSVSGDVNTTDDILKSQKIDTILKNISNPVFGNFLNSQTGKMEGTSVQYDDMGNVLSRLPDGGIDFVEVPDLLETSKRTEDDLKENYNINATNRNELIKDFRRGNYRYNSFGDEVQIYAYQTGKMFEGFRRDLLFTINKAPGEESNYSTTLPVVPLQLSLSLQGIGGIKVGDLFYVNYLPKKYREFCHFMVVNVEHEISTTGWTTKLDSRMIVDIPTLLEKSNSIQFRKYEPFIVRSTINDEINYQVLKYQKVKLPDEPGIDERYKEALYASGREDKEIKIEESEAYPIEFIDGSGEKYDEVNEYLQKLNQDNSSSEPQDQNVSFESPG